MPKKTNLPDWLQGADTLPENSKSETDIKLLAKIALGVVLFLQCATMSMLIYRSNDPLERLYSLGGTMLGYLLAMAFLGGCVMAIYKLIKRK